MKFSRETLADRLFDQLRQQILSGRPAAGQALPSEREIGEAFGVGRTTVREAVGGLVSAGFVERQGRSLIVRDPNSVDRLALGFATVASRESVQQVYAVRKLIEVHAVALAAKNRSEDHLADLRRALARMDTDDPQAYHAADPDFHAAIVRASGNDVLYQLFRSARDVFFKLPTFWRVFGSHRPGGGRPRIGSGHRGHADLLAAIEAGDAELAAERMHALLDKVENDLLAALPPAHEHGADDGAGRITEAGVVAEIGENDLLAALPPAHEHGAGRITEDGADDGAGDGTGRITEAAVAATTAVVVEIGESDRTHEAGDATAGGMPTPAATGGTHADNRSRRAKG